ncbi:MAG: hypothetical protein L3J83_09340 [Proteobacteria bacterium]|nr:hypothetical protein [Pseudomonadota bacterium]
MSTNNSMHLSRRGEFRRVYRLLKRHKLLDSTPIIFCEGDSWFSTPLSLNILDQLVQATPQEQAANKTFFGSGGLFFRAEKSGDTAINMFSEKKVNNLSKWFKSFDFDLVLLSAGGNDFVADFLKDLFLDKQLMSVADAMALVVSSGRYEQVLQAYRVFVTKLVAKKPDIPIIAHSYDYPLLLGKPGKLTLTNIGLIALFKKRIGDWIGSNIEPSLPDLKDKKLFAKNLIDNFVSRVLEPLSLEFPNNFSFVDLRGTLSEEFWYDEMHPTGEGFFQLAQKFKQPILDKLATSKIT